MQQSTLVIVRHGAAFVELNGILTFDNDVTLTVWEDLDFAAGADVGYSYAVDRGGHRLFWYDPQPHPTDKSLASTHPHHKHVHPDIKHNRVPAPTMSFTRPNLPALIQEIERLLAP